MVVQLQAELGAGTEQALQLQQQLQALQFELLQRDSCAAAQLLAERSERERLAAELGQARMLGQARLRQLEDALQQVGGSLN